MSFKLKYDENGNLMNPVNELKKCLMETYENETLDIFNGYEINTKHGSTFQINHHEKINFKLLPSKEVKENLKCDFKLLHGVGESTDRKLKNEGYGNLEDLMEHPKFGERADELLKILDDEENIWEIVKNRYSSSHEKVLACASLNENSQFIFLDIETMGLINVPIILIGIAMIYDDEIEVKQFLLRNYSEELAILSAFNSIIEKDSVFVSFNGLRFDIPFIKKRLENYSIKSDLNNQHIDLLHFSRRLWKNKLPNCQLTSIEEYLFNIHRINDVPSSYIPNYYETYIKTKNIGPLVPIIKHNRMDIVSLALILSKMHEQLF